MAQATKERRRSKRYRDRVVAVVLSLFPLLLVAGLLTPGIVRVLAEEEPEPEPAPAPIIRKAVDLARPPLLVPRDFSAGFIPELLDLDRLFLDTRYRVEPSARTLARLLTFPRHHGDVIVLDELDQLTSDILFDDALVASTVEPSPPEDLGLHPLMDPLPLGNNLRFDDFTGDPVVSPEPGSGLLLGAFLACLACLRRLAGRRKNPESGL